MHKKKVIDFALEFNVSKTTVFKKIKENNIKTQKIKNTSYVISEQNINKLNELLQESPAVTEVLDSEDIASQKEQKNFKKILELDQDSYKYIEKLLLGKESNKDIISEKNDEIERLKKQLYELQQEQSKAQEFDKLLAEKDIRIKALNEDKVNLNRQIEMGIESLQNQQKLMISQNQKLIRLEEENQQLRESLMLTYKVEESGIDDIKEHSSIKPENQSNDPVTTNLFQKTNSKGFFSRLFKR